MGPEGFEIFHDSSEKLLVLTGKSIFGGKVYPQGGTQTQDTDSDCEWIRKMFIGWFQGMEVDEGKIRQVKAEWKRETGSWPPGHV